MQVESRLGMSVAASLPRRNCRMLSHRQPSIRPASKLRLFAQGPDTISRSARQRLH